MIGHTEVVLVDGSDGRRRLTSVREVLECGHVIPIKQDIYGHTNAARRRCRKCLRGDAPDKETT